MSADEIAKIQLAALQCERIARKAEESGSPDGTQRAVGLRAAIHTFHLLSGVPGIPGFSSLPDIKTEDLPDLFSGPLFGEVSPRNT